ncbi:MAG TPA: ABC transporter permease, partial [Chryseolinea sp.]|nr:ABC transporter permease [Chryseolinea sp.]
MLKNNFKFAFRLLSRSKSFSFGIILGLSVSIASAILIVDYAAFELSYDKFFTESTRIYRVHHARYQNNELLYRRAISLPEVGMAMKEYFPEIESSTRLFPISVNIEPVFTAVLKSGERRSFSEPNAYAADSSFCRIFDLDFIYGNPAAALTGLDKTIISRSTAMRYFGTTDVVGETLKGKDGDLTITGVFNDLPANSHFRFDVLLSWFQMYGDGSRFTHDGFYNYILLKDGYDVTSVLNRMPGFVTSYMGDYYKGRPDVRSEFDLQPLTGIHLDSHLDGEMTASGNRGVVNALLLVAIFMIVIAIINHVNLNTSRSLQRIKEVVVRKTIGSTKMQLSMQFLTEAWMMTMTAVVAGLIMAFLLYPSFNSLFNSQISLALLRTREFWGAIVMLIALCSILCGFYPAFLLSGLKVRDALKGSSFGNRKPWFQQVLVTGQFAISLVLVIATYVLFQQVRFMKMQDLGFDMQQKLVIKLLPSYGEESDSVFIRKMATLKDELLNHSLCDVSTISSSIPGRKNEWRGVAGLSGTGDQNVIKTNLTRVDEKFLETFRLNLVAGRNFSNAPGDKLSLIINEEAAKQFGLNADEAIGKKIDMIGHREIIGVVSSFHELGLHENLLPSMYVTGAGYTKFLTVAMNVSAVEDQLSKIETMWKSHFPEKPFQYFFLDDFFNTQYRADLVMSKSIGLFAGIAVFVACLGLFSLSVFTVHRKTKEIGIKKILGASVTRVT